MPRTGRTADKTPKKPSLNVPISPQLHRALNRMAEEMSISKCLLVRMVLAEHVRTPMRIRARKMPVASNA